MTDTTEAPGIQLLIVVPHSFAVREVARGARRVVEDLTKVQKKLTDEGINSDVAKRLAVWMGNGGSDPGVLAQLADQLQVFLPAAEREPAPVEGAEDGQTDAFRDAPVATDPTASAPVTSATPKQVRDALAAVQVFIPAVVIGTWTPEQRNAAEMWALAEALVRGGATELDVPERPDYAVSYPVADDFTREPDGTVRYAGSGTVVAPDTWEAIYEGWAEGQIQKQEEAAVDEAAEDQLWVVVDTGVASDSGQYRVMNRVTRERRLVDPAWALEWSAKYPLEPGARDVAEDYAVKLSDEADAAAAEAAAEIAAEMRAMEMDPPPPADLDNDPAPAAVRTQLARCGYLISDVELLFGWTAAQRVEAIEWATDYHGAAAAEMELPALPPHLAEIQWSDGENGTKVSPAAPGERFNFDLVGKRKPMRVRDTDTGTEYGDVWTPDEAKLVLAAWRQGEAVELRGRTLFVRDAAVRMEQVR